MNLHERICSFSVILLKRRQNSLLHLYNKGLLGFLKIIPPFLEIFQGLEGGGRGRRGWVRFFQKKSWHNFPTDKTESKKDLSIVMSEIRTTATVIHCATLSAQHSQTFNDGKHN